MSRTIARRLRAATGTVGIAVLCLSASSSPATAATIDFESFLGPSTFGAAGDAQTLNIPTVIGNVMVQGGVILTGATNLPADETSIYGTAGNAEGIGVTVGSGFTNPLTLTFATPISNFFLDVLNGNVIDVTYRVADNAGHSADFLLSPNLSSGQTTIGFAATGNIVTISAITGQSTSSGLAWDFFIDNVHFNEPLPPDLTVPEPASLSLAILGIVGVLTRRRRIVA